MRCTLFLLLLLALPHSLPAAPPQFTVTDIGAVSGFPGYANGVFALNDRGQVVGGNGHAFLWEAGRMTDLGAFPPRPFEDGSGSTAYGINNAGQIVGSAGGYQPIFMSGTVSAKAFLYQNGKMTPLGDEDASFEAYGINDKGQIVGLDRFRGFLYENGKVTDFGTLSKEPEGNRSAAQSINNAGQVVGWSTAGKGKALATHAFFWRRGKRVSPLRDLGTLPGCLSSEAWAINDRSQIAGFSATQPYPYTMEAHKRACFWQNGAVRALNTLPGGQDSQAFGLNNSGWIVGWSEINHPPHSAQGDHHAILWRNGMAFDLNALVPVASSWVLEEAYAVNDKWQIVGSGRLNNQRHAFLLTPIRR